MKQCSRCGESKPIEEFGKYSRGADGRRSYCLSCARSSYKREYAWRYSEKNREKERLRTRTSKKLAGWVKPKNTIHEKARAAVRNAVFRGKIVKPTRCPLCGVEAILHAHHHDYSKPFDFAWMCSICHGKEHRQAQQALKEVS